MKTSDREVKLYFKQIRMMLPVYSSSEKTFLRKYKKIVHSYIEENPDCTYEDMIERFEAPVDVVYDYISSLDQEEIYKRISVATYIKKAISVVVVSLIIALLCVTAYEWAMLYDLHYKASKSIITKEVTVIE